NAKRTCCDISWRSAEACLRNKANVTLPGSRRRRSCLNTRCTARDYRRSPPMSTGSRDDQDAVDMERLAAGRDDALNELMERHGERLFHYLIRLLQNEGDAEDLAQESFVRVYQHRARYNARQKFSTWLYAIASNLARDRFRWRARHPQISLEAESEESGAVLADLLAEQKPSPSQSVEAIERAAAV